ncbi:MAG: hypothetical protein ACXVZU_05885, partial [Methanobacteriaceae archaeon]
MEATLIVASFVAGTLSTGFLINPTNPKLNEINEIRAIIRKSIVCGNKFPTKIMRNEIVARIPDIPINLKPNSRPLDTIHVIFPPNLSPSK